MSFTYDWLERLEMHTRVYSLPALIEAEVELPPEELVESDRTMWTVVTGMLGVALAPDMLWRNRHTHAEVRITGFGVTLAAGPYSRAQLMVQTDANCPPGYRHTPNSGQALRSWLEHWEPVTHD